MRTRTELCESCRFWDQADSKYKNVGECHRHAPRPVMLAETCEANWDILFAWPSLTAKDWCGEWGSNFPSPMKPCGTGHNDDPMEVPT